MIENTLPACMGGWCKVRDRCAQHLLADRSTVAERLCPKGEARVVPVSWGESTADINPPTKGQTRGYE